MTAILALWPLIKRFAPLALIGAVLTYAMIERSRANHAEAVKARAVAIVKGLTDASQRYAAASKRAADAKNDQYRRAKEKSDDALTLARTDARGAVDEYLRTHRVRQQDLSNRPGGYVLPQSTAAAAVDHGTSASGDVAISEADFRACTEVNLRLLNAHEWATTLEGQH